MPAQSEVNAGSSVAAATEEHTAAATEKLEAADDSVRQPKATTKPGAAGEAAAEVGASLDRRAAADTRDEASELNVFEVSVACGEMQSSVI